MTIRTEWATFKTLILEEWRLHTELFGGRRFLLFPGLVTLLVAGATVALTETGTALETVLTGTALFALAFGLYSGTAGFVGSDMLENVFGHLTLLLSSSTMLPLSRRRLLGTFLLKDALFYSVVFVLPMAIGTGGVAALEGAGTAVLAIPKLWLSLSMTFAFGMVSTLCLIAVDTRGVPSWLTLIVLIGAGAGAVVWAQDLTGIMWTILITDRSVRPSIGLGLAIVVIGVLALSVYDPTYSKPTRTATDRFARVNGSVPGDEQGLVTKTLLDLVRSSGGILKPFVSAGILLILVMFLAGVVDSITGIKPTPGILFGGVLGLSAFTTYNWLTQFDTVEDYLAYPVSVEQVFRAKRTAFLLVGTPAVAVPYLGAVILFDGTALDAAVGAVVLAGFSLYYYGLTVFLAGFDPNEFLFDAVRFAIFTAGVALPLIPTLVAGFVAVPPPLPVLAALTVGGLVFGGIGLELSRRAGSRWDRKYRVG